jgi:hypothetical protein
MLLDSGKERGDDFSELKSFLLQVDQAIGISQLLLMGTLGNFTLSKRSEILEKSSVNESHSWEVSEINEGATSYLRFPVFLAHFFL